MRNLSVELTLSRWKRHRRRHQRGLPEVSGSHLPAQEEHTIAERCENLAGHVSDSQGPPPKSVGSEDGENGHVKPAQRPGDARERLGCLRQSASPRAVRAGRAGHFRPPLHAMSRIVAFLAQAGALLGSQSDGQYHLNRPHEHRTRQKAPRRRHRGTSSRVREMCVANELQHCCSAFAAPLIRPQAPCSRMRRIEADTDAAPPMPDQWPRGSAAFGQHAAAGHLSVQCPDHNVPLTPGPPPPRRRN